MRMCDPMGILLACIFLLAGCSASRQSASVKTGQHSYSFSGEVRRQVSVGYLLYLPEGYGVEKKQWPLVLFLHGMGERGSDLSLVTRHGPPKLVEAGKKFDFILLTPQCPDDELWSAEVLGALLDEIQRNYSVDPSRVYVTGLSMGGQGTWKLALAYPDRFAAIMPICGYGYPSRACELRNIPIRVYHGAKDRVVPVEQSEKMVEALKKCGGNVQLTVYPEATHDSWAQTYENPEVYEWLLKQSLKNR